MINCYIELFFGSTDEAKGEEDTFDEMLGLWFGQSSASAAVSPNLKLTLDPSVPTQPIKCRNLLAILECGPLKQYYELRMVSENTTFWFESNNIRLRSAFSVFWIRILKSWGGAQVSQLVKSNFDYWAGLDRGVRVEVPDLQPLTLLFGLLHGKPKQGERCGHDSKVLERLSQCYRVIATSGPFFYSD